MAGDRRPLPPASSIERVLGFGSLGDEVGIAPHIDNSLDMKKMEQLSERFGRCSGWEWQLD